LAISFKNDPLVYRNDRGLQITKDLARRSRLGLPNEWKGLGRLNVPGMTRDVVRKLANEGITDVPTLRTVSSEHLKNILPQAIVDRVLDWLKREMRTTAMIQ